MPTSTETALNLEAVNQNPAYGEDTTWITSEKYESTTPEHWQTLPVSYYQRRGNNKLLIGESDIAESSIFRRLLSSEQEPKLRDSEPPIISPVDIHLRSDGLFLWSPTTSQGISIPISSIATYAPTSLTVQPGSIPIPPAFCQPNSMPVLRLDLIPDGDGMMVSFGDGDEDGGFAPSLLVHIALAPDFGGGDGVSDDGPGGEETTTPPKVAQSYSEESQIQGEGVLASSVAAATQALIEALTRCQESLPDADQPDSDDEGVLAGGPGRRIRLPAIHAGSMVLDGDAEGGVEREEQNQGDEVRVAGLGNFTGWVTSENVDEVMRAQGIELNGGDETDGDEEDLGPGAGSRRRREDGEEDGERVTIWQRT